MKLQENSNTDKTKFTRINKFNKQHCTKAYAKFTVQQTQKYIFCHADTGSEMSMISKQYIEYLNIENLQIMKHTQILDTFGGDLCTTKEAVELNIRLEGTTKAFPVLFLINEMTSQCIATVGQDVIRQYAWDIDFGSWGEQCNIWSIHPKTPYHQFKSPIYSDNPLSTHHVYSTKHKAIEDIRYSAPYVDILTQEIHEYSRPKKIQYFVDTGAAESSITTAIMKKESWSNLMDTSERHGLKGLTVTLPTLGRITLQLELQQQEENHTITINHVFQVIESEIEEASIGLPFFIENNLVHSSSLSAISTVNKVKLNKYNYPRDKGVKILTMDKLIKETETYIKADVAVRCKPHLNEERKDTEEDFTKVSYSSNQQMKQVKINQAGTAISADTYIKQDMFNPELVTKGEVVSSTHDSAAVSLAIAADKPPDDNFSTPSHNE